jgi:hypothetical protein
MPATHINQKIKRHIAGATCRFVMCQTARHQQQLQDSNTNKRAAATTPKRTGSHSSFGSRAVVQQVLEKLQTSSCPV